MSRCKDSRFRDSISRLDLEGPRIEVPGRERPPRLVHQHEPGLPRGCPWAPRADLARSLKGLEDTVQRIVCDFELTKDGWLFTVRHGSAPKDALYGFTKLGQLYHKADPGYVGRFTVPTLWDKLAGTMVNNESSEIIRMFYTELDDLLPENYSETGKPGGAFHQEWLRSEVDAMNEWVYNTVNNGVYKTGFATTQEAYGSNLYPLFD